MRSCSALFTLLWVTAIGLGPATPVAAQTWSTYGPNNASITAVAVDPWTSTTVYAGTTGGIFKSTNGGSTWQRTGLPAVGIRSLAVDPLSPATVYAGTTRFGVVKSVDRGDTWHQVNDGITTTTPVKMVVVDPWNAGTVYAVADNLVVKSTDGGAHWTLSSTGLESSTVESLTIDIWRPWILYAGTDRRGVFKSENGGASWQPRRQGVPTPPPPGVYYPSAFALAIDPWVPDTVYYYEFERYLLKSTTGGLEWSNLGNQPFRAKAFVVDPHAHTTVYAATAGNGVLKSVDSGQSWTPTPVGLGSAFTTAIAADPQTPGTLYVGTSDQGLFKSMDAGATWAPINTGLDATPIHTMAIDPWTSTLYAGGDTGLHRSTDRAHTWAPGPVGVINGVDTVAVDVWHPGTIYVVSDGGSTILKSVEGVGVAFVPKPAPAISTLILDPYHPGTLYAGTTFGIGKSVDGGLIWTTAWLGVSTTVTAIAIDPTNPNIVYTAGDYEIQCSRFFTCPASRLSKSTDAGATFTTITSPGRITQLVIDPVTPTTLYAAQLNAVVKSVDGGVTWSQPHPAIPFGELRALVMDAAGATLYAGGSGGVFKTTDGGTTWTPLWEGLIDADVHALVIDPGQPGTIYAGTSNRGVFVLHQP